MSVLSRLRSVCVNKCDLRTEHLQACKMETKTDSFFLIPDASSQDCYDIPRTFPSDRSSSLEGFHNQSVSITAWSFLNLHT